MSGARRLARRVRGTVRAALGERDDPPSTDEFAKFRSLTGPRLVGGPSPRHEPALDGDPRIVVLLPHLDLERMSGGPNTVFQITARLLGEGHRLRYVATSGPLRPDAADLRGHIRRVTGVEVPPEQVDLVDASAPRATLDLGRDDVLIASWWPTAHLADAALAHVRAPAFLYVVQDYEPGFYPWSTKSAMAEASYGKAMRPIVNEPFLESFLRDGRIGHFSDAAWPSTTFMPAVDRDVFNGRHRADRPAGTPRRLVFYARPRNPRNLFEIGLRVMRVAIEQGVFDGEPWEFVAVGQEIPDLPLSPGAMLRGLPWMSYEDYGALLGSSDVLLSLMLSPHTSYPPLEMAATGGLVVTNTFGPKTAPALAAIAPTIRAAAPDVDPLVGALRDAVAELARPSGDGTVAAPISLPTTWDEALKDVTPWIAAQVAVLRAD